MKTSALILLFPFAVFLAEIATFHLEVNDTCKKPEDNTCQKMSCMKAKMPMKCPGKKGNSQKPPGKCNNPDCTICPVCCVFTFQPQYEWSVKYLPLKKNYPLANARYISSYIPAVWKPPNSYSLYS